MSAITVRLAVLSDLEALAPLFDAYRRFYGRETDLPAARAFLRERFERDQSVVFIAHDEGEPAGFTQLYPIFSSILLARTFVLNDLYVHESARRKGIGSELLAAAARFAHSVGAARLSLSTATTNKTAQAVYEAAGWKREERFFVYHLAVNSNQEDSR